MTKKTPIKYVSFRANLPLALIGETKYQHAHIEAGADVPVGINPSVVIDELKEFVTAELKRARDGETPAQYTRRLAESLR